MARGAEEEAPGPQLGRAAVTGYTHGAFPEKTDYHSAFPSPVGQERRSFFCSNDYAKTEKQRMSGTAVPAIHRELPSGNGSAGQGGRGDSDLPPMPPWTPYTPFKRPRDTPGPPLYRKGYVPLSLDRQGPYRALHLVWSGASNQSGTAMDAHPAWPWCRGTYRCKVVLLQRPLAYTPRINRRPGAGGGISCARPRFRQRRIRGSRSDLAFTK